MLGLGLGYAGIGITICSKLD
jgi:hypothetical protein